MSADGMSYNLMAKMMQLPDFQVIPTAVTAIVPNAHHGWNGEYPALFTEMIANWNEQKPAPAALEVQERKNVKTSPVNYPNNFMLMKTAVLLLHTAVFAFCNSQKAF